VGAAPRTLPQVAALAVLLLATLAGACAQGDGSRTRDGHYEYGDASRDGIGKFYMGREIAHVMGHRAAMWLERDGRERDERTDLLIRRLPLEQDSVVADIGAGTGYFSFPVAARVPRG
jgi:hypothetical protein